MTKNAFRYTAYRSLAAGIFWCGIFVATVQAQTNPYAPRQMKNEKVERVKKDRKGSPVMRDTVPRYGKGLVDVHASVVFPMQYFAQAEPGNPDAGYAAQGFGVGLGRFFPFGSQSPVGIQFSLGYVRMGATAFGGHIQSVLDDFVQSDSDAQDETLELDSDFRPRYHMLPFSIGLAYEGSGKKADVYARFMLHGAFSSMNDFTVRGDESGLNVVNVDRGWSTGIGMELGARLHNALRVGVAWQYLGRPEMSYNVEAGGLPGRALTGLNGARPISILAVNLGFSVDRSLSRRKGARTR